MLLWFTFFCCDSTVITDPSFPKTDLISLVLARDNFLLLMIPLEVFGPSWGKFFSYLIFLF